MARFHNSRIRSLHYVGFERTSALAAKPIIFDLFESLDQQHFLNPFCSAKSGADEKIKKAKDRLCRRRRHASHVSDREKNALKFLLGFLIKAATKSKTVVGEQVVKLVTVKAGLSSERVYKLINKLVTKNIIKKVGKASKRVCLAVEYAKAGFEETLKKAEEIIFGRQPASVV
jgi:predicted transcriptional regulator